MADSGSRTVGDLMSPVVITAHPDDKIGTILSNMDKLRFRHLPVVEDGRLVGVVTQKDLLHASSSFLSDQAPKRDVLIGNAAVRSIMQGEVLTAKESDLLLEVGSLMQEAKVGCLPVVDDAGAVVGILTESDFIRLALWYLKNAD
jgi:CBS domain-containing protein